MNEEVVKWKSCDQHPFFQYFCRTRPAAIRCYNVSWRVQETLPLTLTHSTLYVLRADYSLYAPTWTKAFDCNCTGRKRNSEDGTTIDRKDVLFLALSLTDLKSGISPLLPPAGFPSCEGRRIYEEEHGLPDLSIVVPRRRRSHRRPRNRLQGTTSLVAQVL